MELRTENKMNFNQLATIYELEKLRLDEKTSRDLALACWDTKLALLKKWGYEEYEIETINDLLYLAEKKGIFLVDLFKALDLLKLASGEDYE